MSDHNTPTVPPLPHVRRKGSLTNRERAIILVNAFFDRYKDDEVVVEELMELDTEEDGDTIKDLTHRINITRKF